MELGLLAGSVKVCRRQAAGRVDAGKHSVLRENSLRGYHHESGLGYFGSDHETDEAPTFFGTTLR